MLYVSLRDGSVRKYDLRTDSGLSDCSTELLELGVASAVRGLALGLDGARVDLPAPRRFRRVVYRAEVVLDRAGAVVSERVSAVCDDVVVSLTMHLNGRGGRFRLDVDRRGTARFLPGS